MSLMDDAVTNEEEEELQIRLAIELSLSLQKEPSLVHSQHEAAMPSDFVLKSIPPNGWCFYDCVREHLHLASDGSEMSIFTSSIAALCLSCLALRREESRAFLEDPEKTHDQRKENVFKHRQYRDRSVELEDDFLYIYILDKLEAVFALSAVVDTLHYADTLEIEAFLQHFHLSMLRLRPRSKWTRNDVGFSQGLDEDFMMRPISSEEQVRRLMTENLFDLQLLHYQYPTYEHYDIVHLENGSYGIPAHKKAGLAK